MYSTVASFFFFFFLLACKILLSFRRIIFKELRERSCVVGESIETTLERQKKSRDERKRQLKREGEKKGERERNTIYGGLTFREIKCKFVGKIIHARVPCSVDN